jgi:hypothetical protein
MSGHVSIDMSTHLLSFSVERLNEHSLEGCLSRWKATAIYIVGGWVCHGFNIFMLNWWIGHFLYCVSKLNLRHDKQFSETSWLGHGRCDPSMDSKESRVLNHSLV